MCKTARVASELGVRDVGYAARGRLHYWGVFVRVSETHKPRQTGRDRQTETNRPKQTIDIVRAFVRVSCPTETDRLTDRDRQTQTDRLTDRDRQTNWDRQAETEQAETDRDRQTDTDRDRQTETDRPRQTGRDTQAETDTPRPTARDRQTHTLRAGGFEREALWIELNWSCKTIEFELYNI